STAPRWAPACRRCVPRWRRRGSGRPTGAGPAALVAPAPDLPGFRLASARPVGSPAVSDLLMTAAELDTFLRDNMPDGARGYVVEHAGVDGVRVRSPFHPEQIRPGGTVSGPTLMALADCAAWLVTLSRIGPVALAVTSNLTISFLRKPEPMDVLAHASLLRLGRRQSVSEVRLWSEGGTPDEPVAHATITYAIPSSAAS